MNIVIIEDEAKQLELLREQLDHSFPDLKVLAVADAVLTGVSAIRQYQPDLIFLDVMIKGGTAFELLEQLPDLDGEVIFTTSYEKYAVQAFRMSAVDYLLKPIDPEELKQAVNKARARLMQSNNLRHLELLMSNHRNRDTDQQKIALPTFKGYTFVQPDDIVRCESDNTYTTFFLKSQGEIVVSKTLKACEDMLTPFAFCRVHNRSLINLKHVTSYERGEGGIVTMVDGAAVPVSRRRKEQFLQMFESP